MLEFLKSEFQYDRFIFDHRVGMECLCVHEKFKCTKICKKVWIAKYSFLKDIKSIFV